MKICRDISIVYIYVCERKKHYLTLNVGHEVSLTETFCIEVYVDCPSEFQMSTLKCLHISFPSYQYFQWYLNIPNIGTVAICFKYLWTLTNTSYSKQRNYIRLLAMLDTSLINYINNILPLPHAEYNYQTCIYGLKFVSIN